MILSIYITLSCLSLVLLFAGYWLDGDLFKVLGYSFLFIVNVVPLTDGGIQFHSGDTIDVISSSQTVVTKDYTLFNSFYLFFFMSVLGALGILFVSVETSVFKKLMEDD